MLRLHSLSSPAVAAQNPKQGLASEFSTRARVFSTNSFGFAPSLSSSRKRHSLKCRQSEYFDQQRASTASAPNKPAPQTPTGATGLPPRFFVRRSIYKGKAALTVEPKAPEFTTLDSGAFKLSREGFVLLHFAPAAGVRVYDWSRKQVFSLSVTEVGSLVCPTILLMGKGAMLILSTMMFNGEWKFELLHSPFFLPYRGFLYN